MDDPKLKSLYSTEISNGKISEISRETSVGTSLVTIPEFVDKGFPKNENKSNSEVILNGNISKMLCLTNAKVDQTGFKPDFSSDEDLVGSKLKPVMECERFSSYGKALHSLSIYFTEE